MSEPRTQIAIAVVERDGCFLVGQRPVGKSLAGYAEFPGGRVEDGETPEQAAVRECFEETGIAVTAVGRYDDLTHDYAHDRVHLYFVACQIAQAKTVPHVPFRWVLRQELGELQFPEANSELLRLLLQGD